MESLRAAWRGVPEWARWPLAFVALLGLSAGGGAMTGAGAGNAIFLSGALSILASIAFIRTGGDRKRAGRDAAGDAIWTRDPEGRRGEIRMGVRLFVLGLALWASLGVGNVVGAALARTP